MPEKPKKPSWPERISSWIAGIGFLLFAGTVVYALIEPFGRLLKIIRTNPTALVGLAGLIIWMVGCILWHHFHGKENNN